MKKYLEVHHALREIEKNPALAQALIEALVEHSVDTFQYLYNNATTKGSHLTGGVLATSVIHGVINLANYLPNTLFDKFSQYTVDQTISGSEWNEMAKHINAGRKVDAIKFLRSLTGWGFKESKDAVEYISAHHSVSV